MNQPPDGPGSGLGSGSGSRPGSVPDGDLRTIGEAARLLGVTVRTLRHWDAVGLLEPAHRSWSDYRLYSDGDLARAGRILVYREAGVPLADIADILGHPASPAAEVTHLRRQRHLLEERIAHLRRMLGAVDQLLEAHDMDRPLTPEEAARVLGENFNPDHAHEAEQRWGGTDAWSQSQHRTGSMARADWEAVQSEQEALAADIADAHRRGLPADGPEARELVARHRASIGNFYDCSASRQVLLARMYTCDERFRAHYDSHAPGTADWLLSAVEAAARGEGVDLSAVEWD